MACGIGDCIEIEKDHAAADDLEPAAAFPDPQLLVRAFAGQSDHSADLLLGDRDPPGVGGKCLVGKTEQRLREPLRCIEKQYVLEMLSGGPESGTEKLNDLDRDLRFAMQQLEKIASAEGYELAIRYGDRIRRSRLPVQQSHFAEQLPIAQNVEHGLPAVFPRHGNFDTAAADRVEAVASVALLEDDVPALEECGSSDCAQSAKILVP